MYAGDLYYQHRLENPQYINDPNLRYHTVLSATRTHVYIRNVRTGFSRNVDIGTFNKNYSLVH